MCVEVVRRIGYHNMIAMILVMILSSCDEFVNVEPPKNETASPTVYSNDETALASMRGLYIQLQQDMYFIGGAGSVPHVTGLSSDELLNDSSLPALVQFYSNDLTSMNDLSSALWQKAYATIFHANSIIEGVSNSSGMTETSKKQLEGEAKFIRAYFHFYLVNLFGDVPLVTSTNYKVNNTVSRTPKHEVYQQIKADLKDAKNLMIADYSTEGGQRIRPNKWAATAFLARVYLYEEDWLNATAQATEVISQSSLFSLSNNLDNVFLKNSNEAIWQLMPVVPNFNTFDGNLFVIISTTPTVELSPSFLEAFESGDNRLTKWVGSYIGGGDTLYYPYKYKIKSGATPLNEYTMVLRLAEQYLIRAEASAQLDNITEAQADLNILRIRARLDPVLASTKGSLLVGVEQERRMELFTEGGHRWFDLKRWSNATKVLTSLKSGWSRNDMLYPIPQTEIGSNPNLKPQNPGY